jgi:hypothetical protein
MIGVGNKMLAGNVSKEGWNLSTLTYASKNYLITTSVNEIYPECFFIKPDGLKFWLTGQNLKTVFQFSLATAWDITTATYDNISYSISSRTGYPRSLYFSPDGQTMIIGTPESNTFFQFYLSTPWNVSTASYVRTNTVSYAAHSAFIDPTGTKLMLSYLYNYRHTLTTAWNISSISYTSQSLYYGGWGAWGIFMSSDGVRLYVVDSQNHFFKQFTLSTAWNVGTASIVASKDSSIYDTQPKAIFFNDIGTKMYFFGRQNLRIYQFSLTA